jgi:hypothetical protein
MRNFIDDLKVLGKAAGTVTSGPCWTGCSGLPAVVLIGAGRH